MYLNTQQGFESFKERLRSKVFVDKSMIIEILNERIGTDDKYICITRPRRFGKSQITYLLESYYSKEVNGKEIFDKLKISSTANYEEYLNKYNVIKLDFSDVEVEDTYEQYIGRIKRNLIKDLERKYTEVDLEQYDLISNKLLATEEKFIFIIDEWDFIFNKGLYIQNQKNFLEFLRNLLKGKTYVALCYMTGILPIKKHSTGSALNMFEEYTLLDDSIFEEYFGFTEEEVQKLCLEHDMPYEEVKRWYNGYLTENGIRVFNPRSVNIAITKKKCKSYWVNTGAMDEVLLYLRIDPDEVRDDVLRMVAGEEVEAYDIEEFRAGQEFPTTKEEVYSAMITLGFLTYFDGMMSIPNKELMKEFEKALKAPCFGEIAILAKKSQEVLRATLNCDADKVAQIIQEVHNLRVDLYDYSKENGLTYVVDFAYMAARDRYRIEKEEHCGKGRADFTFHPISKRDIPMIIELKCNDDSQTAIDQIVEREYSSKLFNLHKRDILIIGINYDGKTKVHTCEIKKLYYNLD
ncbi:MAG: AAA family ATPase [Epulopiscium sp. Nuni2H_MBin003]|nr:MAG: AAA family ATPase [Epulopiscium sp. Nuni2H_MBin003]